MRLFLSLSLLLFLFLSPVLHAQTAQVEFGKNRVQYHRDFANWEKYESDNFVTYWYGNGQGLGQAVVQFAEYDFGYIQKMLEHRMNEKIQLIVYRDVTDLKQSNIGSEEVFTVDDGQNIGRSTNYISATQTKFLGNKAFVYFNGDHTDLRRQVREALASVYIEHMLYGSSIQEVVQNAVLLNLPPWFKTGLVAYLGEDWNTQLDDQLRQLLESGEYETFEDLANDYPRLAGHSFWYYVAENLGKSTVSNLLYLTRINRSVENGFLYVLGSNYDNVLFNWKEFYNTRYREDMGNRERVDAGAGEAAGAVSIKNKRNLPITDLKLSPDGQRIAYVLNEIGKYKVYIQDLNTGERTLVKKGGQRNLLQAADYNYPILDWSPSNQELAVLYEFRDVPKLLLWNLNEKKPINDDILGIQIDRVYSMAYADPGSMILSASLGGFTDLLTYFPASRQFFRITNDFYDDLDAVPVRVMGRPGVVFSSNRTDDVKRTLKLDTVLPIANFDLYYYDLEGKPGEFVRITDSPLANERQPAAIDETHFSFLSDENGIFNRYQAHLEPFVHHYERTIFLNDGTEIVLHADSSLAKLDSTLIDSFRLDPVIRERAVVEAVTNLATNIERQDGAGRLPMAVELLTVNEGALVRRVSFDTSQTVSLTPTAFRRRSYRMAGQAVPRFTSLGGSKGSNSSVISPNQINPEREGGASSRLDDAYLFQTRFDDTEIAPEPVIPDPVTERGEEAGDSSILDRDPVIIDTDRPADAGGEEVVTEDGTDRPNVTIVENPNKRKERLTNRYLSGEREVIPLNRIYRFRPGRITPYRSTFRVNYVKTTVDNDPLFSGLNSFAANPDGYTRQPVGILFKGNVMDLFEDVVIEGGVRIPTSFNGTEYFLTATDRRRRLDYIYSVYRRNRRREEGNFGIGSFRQPRLVEENTLLAQFGVRYPLDVFRSLRATATVRRDRVQELPTELIALRNRPDNRQQFGVRLEYVFDNTLSLGTNMRMGTRYKVYGDAFKSFNLSLSGENESSLTPGMLGIVGVDARHYQRLDKRTILALRVAGATNFGQQKVLYYLGGADNALSNAFNSAIPTPTTGDFVYQDLANPMRGFDVNIRNGGTYLLTSAEVRIPIFNYLARNIRSAFIRDFQIVGFTDAGTAWSGSDPFDEDNPVNITTYPDPALGGGSPVTVRVRRFREPIVYGYGVGVRTTVFGYFVRADYAWGVETGIRQEPKLHFALGLDF